MVDARRRGARPGRARQLLPHAPQIETSDRPDDGVALRVVGRKLAGDGTTGIWVYDLDKGTRVPVVVREIEIKDLTEPVQIRVALTDDLRAKLGGK